MLCHPINCFTYYSFSIFKKNVVEWRKNICFKWDEKVAKIWHLIFRSIWKYNYSLHFKKRFFDDKILEISWSLMKKVNKIHKAWWRRRKLYQFRLLYLRHIFPLEIEPLGQKILWGSNKISRCWKNWRWEIIVKREVSISISFLRPREPRQ